MPRSLAAQDERTPAKSHREALDELSAKGSTMRMQVKTDEKTEEKRTFRAVVREVMRRVDLSQKAFAINAGQSESVISEALSGTRHLAMEWLWAQEDTFWNALIEAIEDERGLTQERATELYAQQIGTLVESLLKHGMRRTA